MADDLIPTKDISNNANRNLPNEAILKKSQVSKYSRDELEDKFLRMYEEYIILKKHARKQEDKIKRMATKLLRLVNDKKKLEKEGKGVRSVEVEEKFEEMTARIQALEKQNSQLKEKLTLTKQMASVGPKRGTYTHVRAVIDTNRIPSKHSSTVQIDPRITHKNLRVMGPHPTHVTMTSSEQQLLRSSPSPQYGHSILEATRADKNRLEDQLAQMREQVQVYEMEIENLKEQNKLQKAEFDEDLLKIKQKITTDQKHNLQENIDMIKLQREIKEKSTVLTVLQSKYEQLEQSSRTVKQAHEQILREMEHLNLQLQEEENRNLTLQNQLKLSNNNEKKVLELQEQVSDLQKECNVLKEANEKLSNTVTIVIAELSLDEDSPPMLDENVKQLFVEYRFYGVDPSETETPFSLPKPKPHQTIQFNFSKTIPVDLDTHYERRRYLESQVDFTEIEEALVLIKQKKQRDQRPPDFLQEVEDEFHKDHKKALLELQAEFAETVHELEKTRNMLIVQHKINKDYQTEVTLSTNKLDEVKKEYEMKLDEYARLLDIRAARIKKLESQLRDVAYGTRQYRIPPPDDDAESTITDFDETVSLERGQNLFEIHIDKINLSKDALEKIGDEEPNLFCTWEFFEFEIQSTPVVRGARPVFDFTSQYIVRVDDFFLHYLQKDSCTVELHQSFGQDYKTIAACQLVFSDIFDKLHGRIHGTASLTGITDGETGIGYGTIDYWVRMRVPMEQALRLYKERTKALGYIMTNERLTKQALEALDETAAMRPPDNINELHVKIIRCSRLQSRRPNVQPSPYCAYKLLDFPDHDTIILRNTNNPEFNDHKIYSVPVSAELDQYLRTTKLQLFVFDDTDPDVESYLGLAEIPLLPLAHNKPVSGEFQLTRGAGNAQSGVIEVEMKWQYIYLPPKLPKHEPQEPETADVKMPRPPVDHPTPEELVGPVRPEAPLSPKKQRGPTATSTPLDKNKLKAVEDQIIPAGSHQPKAAARRKVQISEDETNYSENKSNAVNDTVSRVVSNFMPSMSESLTDTLQDQNHHMPSTILEETASRLSRKPSVESEEGEELQARPTPPRSSLQMESGSEDESERSLYEHYSKVSSYSIPKPMVRTKWLTSKTMKDAYLKPKSPVTSTHEDEGNIEEEIEEDIEDESKHEVVDSARSSEVSETTAVESDSEGVMLQMSSKSKRKSKQTKAVSGVFFP
uniref:C2 domain-containing protein n=1 Tax=Biomphalaria glabrata TaxID=6526 RepID=A0A2C9M2E5_BIOGL